MNVEAISGIAQGGLATAPVEQTQDKGFSDLLGSLMDNIEETEAQSQAASLSLITGGDTGIHDAMIAMEKAELALSLGIQVRNKVMDAYKEIMQMQV